MVSYSAVKASNARVASTLPSGLVAVFVGATSGIGEYTLKAFAQHAARPRVYFVGRSQEAGNRIAGECRALNPEGQFTFVQADVSLMRNVDDVCRDIQAKESAVNLLFQSQGSLAKARDTPEGLPILLSLFYYSRIRFAQNLLPQLARATALRRVVCVGAGGKEGPIVTDDLGARGGNFLKLRGHAASMLTLGLAQLAAEAPAVAFVHDYPGVVKSGIGREAAGILLYFINYIAAALGPLIGIPPDESGERHLFLATSAAYPPATAGDAAGVPLDSSAGGVAAGIDGKPGSGTYPVGADNESCGTKVASVLAKVKDSGDADFAWKNTQEEFKRIAGDAK